MMPSDSLCKQARTSEVSGAWYRSCALACVRAGMLNTSSRCSPVQSILKSYELQWLFVYVMY